MKFHMLVLVTIVSLSIYLIFAWLPAGMLIGGGDIGLPNFLPQKQLKDVMSAWWDSHGTGVSSPIAYTAIPYYIFLSSLDILGFEPYHTQKIIFFLIIAGSAVSIYFIGLQFAFKKWVALLAALFYIFNLTSLSVWHRGVHNAMLMLLLAPLSLLILVWGMRSRKYVSIVLINIVSLLLAYVFGALGYIFSLWLLWIVYILIILIHNRRNKSNRRFIFLYSFILVISWVGINFWWIGYLFSSGNYILDQFSAEELKIKGSDMLVALKASHEPSTILRGLNKYYMYDVKDWGYSYLNPLLLILSWIPTVVIFSTTLIRSNYRSITWRFLILLMIIVLIISKGINPPFGLLNKIPFDFFPFLAPLRNSYEKVGIILIIPFSLLFALGFEQINTYLRSKKLGYLQPFNLLVIIACLTVLVWPLWFGKLFTSRMFTSGEKKIVVSIPPYYAQASEWMREKTRVDDTRILHLPLAWWESIDYDWGYTGIEPSQYFFYGSSIGYHLGINPVDLRIRNLLLLIHNQDTQNLQKAFASLNIGWIIIHNETLFRDRMLEPPERINAWLATNPYFLEKENTIGPLSIWRVKDKYRAGHFYSAGELINLEDIQILTSLNMWNYIDNINDSFFIDNTSGIERSMLEKFTNKRVVLPKLDSAKENLDVILNVDTSRNLVGDTFNLSDIDVTASYRISFDFINEGEYPLYLTITHDNDPVDGENKVQPSIVRELKVTNDLQWHSVTLNYNPTPNATSAVLGFRQIKNVSAIKNLRVEKISNRDPVLKEDNSVTHTQLGTAKIQWNKINPTLYELILSEQTFPYILIFSETFHPLWQITDSEGKKIDLPHFNINGFANGWLIEEKLPQNIRIEFVLQRFFTKGIILSLLFFISSSVLLCYLNYRRGQK